MQISLRLPTALHIRVLNDILNEMKSIYIDGRVHLEMDVKQSSW